MKYEVTDNILFNNKSYSKGSEIELTDSDVREFKRRGKEYLIKPVNFFDELEILAPVIIQKRTTRKRKVNIK